jgi:hypothetical protein
VQVVPLLALLTEAVVVGRGATKPQVDRVEVAVQVVILATGGLVVLLARMLTVMVEQAVVALAVVVAQAQQGVGLARLRLAAAALGCLVKAPAGPGATAPPSLVQDCLPLLLLAVAGEVVEPAVLDR